MSSLVVAPERPGSASAPTPSRRTGLGRGLVPVLLLAAGLGALTFTTSGGVSEPPEAGNTWSEIALQLLGAGAVAAAALTGAPRPRQWGAATIGLLAALTLLTGLSIAWSVQPDYSWQATGQMLAYLAVFSAAATAARAWPGRWPVLVTAVTLAAAALSAYALAFKVFPATLDTGVTFGAVPPGRLQGPLGYWNATGLLAALGLPGCLWGATRRPARPWAAAIAAPSISVLVAVIVLSFSRSAALAALVAVAMWLAFVPLRLRTVALLAVGCVGGAAISAWALARPALSADGQPLAARVSAGHTFGVVILVAVLPIAAAGLGLGLALSRVSLAERARRRAGAVLLGLLALVVVAAVAALAASHRGLTGEVSHAWQSLTSTSPQVGNSSQRLLQLGSSRATYWHEGFRVGEHAPLAGVGAEAFGVANTAYTAAAQPVQSAHSYLVETFADLGLIGVVLTLALLVAWGLAAARALAVDRSRGSLAPERLEERAGMFALAAVAVAFGVQSAIDWTWFFTAVAVPALLSAGWLAGRGPLQEPGLNPGGCQPALSLGRLAAVTGLAAVTLLAAWMTWQPLRSADRLSAAYDAAVAGDTGQAFTDARQAAAIDPVSAEPPLVLSYLYSDIGQTGAARAELVQGTRRQPRNPETWLSLGQFDLQHHRPARALAELERALSLDLGNQEVLALVAQAQAQAGRS